MLTSELDSLQKENDALKNQITSAERWWDKLESDLTAANDVLQHELSVADCRLTTEKEHAHKLASELDQHTTELHLQSKQVDEVHTLKHELSAANGRCANEKDRSHELATELAQKTADLHAERKKREKEHEHGKWLRAKFNEYHQEKRCLKSEMECLQGKVASESVECETLLASRRTENEQHVLHAERRESTIEELYANDACVRQQNAEMIALVWQLSRVAQQMQPYETCARGIKLAEHCRDVDKKDL